MIVTKGHKETSGNDEYALYLDYCNDFIDAHTLRRIEVCTICVVY